MTAGQVNNLLHPYYKRPSQLFHWHYNKSVDQSLSFQTMEETLLIIFHPLITFYMELVMHHLKNGRAAHAWIISSGDVNDIENPSMNISGGPVDDSYPNFSSSKGELMGIAALSIIGQLLLKLHSSTACFSVTCNNQGIINKCFLISFNKLNRHH
jgi:hypothetical protein